MNDWGTPEASLPRSYQVEHDLLMELSRTISKTLDLTELVQLVSDGTARLFGVETTALYLVEDDALILAATTPPLDPQMPQSLRRAKREDHPHLAQALATQQPQVLSDTKEASLSPAERAVVEARKLRSLLFFPFSLDGSPIGCLILGTVNEKRTFGAHEVDFCHALAGQLAVAVQNARLHGGLKNHAAALERQIAEQARLEERLRHAQKMEAVGQLAGGMAHDFNNFLQIIAGYSDIARNQLPPESEVRESIDLVLQAVRRASGLVRQLLAFARRQVLALQVVDVGQTIDALLPMLHPLLGEHISVSSRFDARPACVRADRHQLEQMLVNLCVNARDAMPEGGALTIATEREDSADTRAADIAFPAPGPYVRISVTDSGRGMDEETRTRAFEPFFTTKEPGAGTGLGLSMVHGLVAQHGGVAHITSAPGQGTTVALYLPAVPQQECRTPAQPKEAARGGSETILFVEDNQMVRELTYKILTSAGYAVISASDGVEAMNLLPKHAQTIDLALLDLVMPRLGGEAVSRALRAQRADIPVIFASGHGADALSNPASGSADEFLHKPYTSDELLAKVRRALDAGRAKVPADPRQR